MPGKNKVYYNGDNPMLEDNYEPYTHGDYNSPSGVGADGGPMPDCGRDRSVPENPPQKSFDN